MSDDLTPEQYQRFVAGARSATPEGWAVRVEQAADGTVPVLHVRLGPSGERPSHRFITMRQVAQGAIGPEDVGASVVRRLVMLRGRAG